ncbi:MAG: tRNA adenosine(34) deaminase TadA [Gammaproteobacteria bacterium]|nr:tRNA adenosine(34) deaminase TadA [Gammaproteobacteria bacterium]MCF6336475.1 tRNA adenosine(34) deaminase TadA [Gammaproteobacteria bacterium]
MSALSDYVTLNSKPEQRTLDEQWMAQAMQLASRAEAEGEVPIGALAVCEGEVIGRGWNRSISTHDPSAHAEIMALREAGQAIENYRLCDVTLYVTLEPCAMCAGAMLHGRIARLVVGASDPKTGAAGSVLNVLEGRHTFHQVAVEKGVLAERCAEQLRQFFRDRRAASKSKLK